MPLPLAIPLALLASSSIAGASANFYSQAKQRELYRYQRGGYERQLRDWNANVGKGHRFIRYPEFSYPGKIRALDTGISQSYASSVGTLSHLSKQLGGEYAGFAYKSGSYRSLYSRSTGHTSRFL